MQIIYLLTSILVFPASFNLCLASPTKVEDPASIPTCNTNPNSVPSCNFTNAVRDITRRKIEIGSGTSWRLVTPWPTYIDCNECLYYEEWWNVNIFWSEKYGSIVVDNDPFIDNIWRKWMLLNSTTREALGHPISEGKLDVVVNEAYVQHQRGRMYEGYLGAIYGPIYERWMLEGDSQFLGVPSTDIFCTSYEAMSNRQFCSCPFEEGFFDRIGEIHWDSETGAHVVPRRIYETWWFGDWPGNPGHAITEAQSVQNSSTSYIEFANGNDRSAIFWNDTETFLIQPEIWNYIQNHGGANGTLGLPLTNATSTGRFFGRIGSINHGQSVREVPTLLQW